MTCDGLDLGADEPKWESEDTFDSEGTEIELARQSEDEDDLDDFEPGVDECGSYFEDEEASMRAGYDTLEVAKKALRAELRTDAYLQARNEAERTADERHRQHMAKLDEYGLRHLEDSDGHTTKEYQRLKAHEEAKRIIRAERRGRNPLPSFTSLKDALNEPEEDEPYVVSELMPVGAIGLLVAQAKAGKTSLIDNLLRTLVDLQPFLGRFEACAQPRVVALIDTEMGRVQRLCWLREQGIEAVDRIHLVTIRGRAGSFDVTDPDVRAEWVAKLQEVGADYVVLDNVRPVLDALGKRLWQRPSVQAALAGEGLSDVDPWRFKPA